MPPRDQLAALKERAGVVAALLDGRQTVLVRSSDLPPSTDDLADPFALYPSYSHQDPDRYGDRDLRYYHGSTTKPADGIPLRGVAEVEAVHHVETDRLASLTPYYVYTEAGLRDKYRLDDQAEARVLVVRTRELENPRLIEERGAYRGCRTWIDLADDVDVDPDDSTPILDDAEFAERRAAVENALE
ncbi:DUF1802 family protein [Haloarculaceae archaeon H-GB1-1]|nr:DUF1802 family protein [Haloarculaceae archaeon H-GB1-1]